MKPQDITRQELAAKASEISSCNALVGLDGFVDLIISVVDKRSGPGDRFSRMETIADLGARISAAAGKSANIELYPRIEKLGGNGPIMANALLAAGHRVRYIGALGKASIHPAFAELADRTRAVSVCDPGFTQALEFDDGKIMLGTMASLDEITYPNIIAAMGEGAFLDALSRADLVALVNWTMIPHMTSVFKDIIERALPSLGPRERGRTFFFDLADPEKRNPADIKSALHTISRFQAFGRVTLGLNYSEAQQIDRLSGNTPEEPTESGLKALAARIRRTWDLYCVVVHPVQSAACALKEDTWWVEGPYCTKPLITTGGGDHFNAGFATGLALGLSPIACLTLGVATSGNYVRTAKSPNLYDTDEFLANWV